MSYPLPKIDTSWKQDLAEMRTSIDRKVLSLSLLAAVILCLQHYFAQYSVLANWLKPFVPDHRLEMAGSLAWCGLIGVLYLGIPALWIKIIFKQPLSDYGWSLKGLRHHWKPYAIFFVMMLGPLLFAATTPAFQNMYPFFKYVATGWQFFLIWQIAYGLQFIAVEFFFRGFLLFGLYDRIGLSSAFLVAIPYCMIHFPKPLGESLGAIAAGLVMSYLALKNRSIWGGAALHWAVAFTMDLAAICL